MNVFLRELKANRKALIIWSVCMFIFVLSGMTKYTAYSTNGTNKILNDIPRTMKVLFGMGSFDVTKMSGFYAFLFPYIEITVAIHAVLLGSGIIAKEERDKTTEFLMVKPVSRTSVITAKYLAGFVNILIINLVTMFSSIVLVNAYNKGKDITLEIAVFMVSMFMVQLIFFSLGSLLASLLKRPKAAGSIGTGILLGAFVISKITDFTDHLNVLNILSPFKYFSIEDIINKNSLYIVIVMVCILLIAVFSVSTYLFYTRRDLNV